MKQVSEDGLNLPVHLFVYERWTIAKLIRVLSSHSPFVCLEKQFPISQPIFTLWTKTARELIPLPFKSGASSKDLHPG
jgi:hypothetical protein